MFKAILYIESTISNALLSAGLQANLQGFQYLKEATMEVLKQPSLLQHLTKQLYPKVGKMHNQSPAVVERSMRHVIDVAYRSQALYGLNDVMEAHVFTPSYKPCNGNFIASVCEYIKKDLYKLIATTNQESSPERYELAQNIQEFLQKYNTTLV